MKKTKTKTNLENLKNAIADEVIKARSAWDKGILFYCQYMLMDITDEQFDENNQTPEKLEKLLLNGASDWKQASWGGCFFCYDYQIAETLATPSELKRTKNGDLKPNRFEHWLDVQSRALYQANAKIKKLYFK